jgi:Protein of unknown function (DUF2723)
MSRWRLAAACTVTGVAFALYHATLLAGLDFGDTASFQTMVGSPTITPRDGYPLYFALGGALLHLTGGDPARSLNLASAVQGAIACGILMVVASEISGSVLAGMASALLFAGSYTFWSQSIIAEVYALHMLFVALTLDLLLRWEKRPTLGRLGAFFAVYALGFGNHLSMILLAPAYTLFLLASAPRGWRSMFTPPVIALAVAAAASGAMQYAWNLRTLWLGSFPPHGLVDALGTAWFEITKSDWRETMVMQVPRGMAGDHASMYAFDVLQQFGWIGPLLAALGLAGLVAERWRVALLIAGAYLVNALFAYSYKVGDAHVFYLPSHFMIAVLMAPGIVVVASLAARFYRAGVAQATAGTPGSTAAGGATAGTRLTAIAALVVIAYAGLRIYRDYPALDRSNDHRPTDVLRALTTGLDDRHAILLVDLNWQIQNGLSYFARVDRPDLAYARMPDVLLYAPELIRDNLDIGRAVALTDRARAELVKSYGPLIPTITDSRVEVPGISDLVQGLAPGTPYVLSILKPVPDFSLDADDLIRAMGTLTAGQLRSIPDGDYAAIAGLVGATPTLVAGANGPFRRRLSLGDVEVEIRMESWLSSDTIRRMGFGHVIAAHRHTLIIERGVSFVTFDRSGRSTRSGYVSGIFAPQPRYLCYR